MEYTIELTDEQKAQMDCIMEVVYRYDDFIPKLEPIKTTDVEDTNEYQIGYKVGYNGGLTKQSDPHFVPLQKCPVRLEDCKAYKLGFEDGKKMAIDENAKDHQGYYDNGYNNAIEDFSHAIKVYYPLNSRERLDYFGLNIHADNYAIENPKDLIAKAKAYEDKKKAEEESIKVGDEVYLLDKYHPIIVTSVDDDNTVCLAESGKYTYLVGAQRDRLTKTGRHFDEVEQLLHKLRGE